MFFERYLPKVEPEIPSDFTDIDDVIEQDERDPKFAAKLAGARQRMADRLSECVGTLASLRLRRGWSQKRLADAMGTSQSHIARIESGTEDIRMSTLTKLAAVLDVPASDILLELLSERSKR